MVSERESPIFPCNLTSLPWQTHWNQPGKTLPETKAMISFEYGFGKGNNANNRPTVVLNGITTDKLKSLPFSFDKSLNNQKIIL
jgi:hypothetical protein